MNRAVISRKELHLVVDAIMKAHRRLEREGDLGEDFGLLRALEDRLGALQGQRFNIIATE